MRIANKKTFRLGPALTGALLGAVLVARAIAAETGVPGPKSDWPQAMLAARVAIQALPADQRRPATAKVLARLEMGFPDGN